MNNQLSEHFTLSEMTQSSTADRYNINNTPGQFEYDNLKKLCEEVLEPIRRKWGKPIFVNSGYRSPQLNIRVKGAASSQHITGCAVDITSENNEKLFHLIVSMLNNNEIEVSQLIDERNYSWLHLGLYVGRKHNQVLHL